MQRVISVGIYYNICGVIWSDKRDFSNYNSIIFLSNTSNNIPNRRFNQFKTEFVLVFHFKTIPVAKNSVHTQLHDLLTSQSLTIFSEIRFYRFLREKQTA